MARLEAFFSLIYGNRTILRALASHAITSGPPTAALRVCGQGPPMLPPRRTNPGPLRIQGKKSHQHLPDRHCCQCPADPESLQTTTTRHCCGAERRDRNRPERTTSMSSSPSSQSFRDRNQPLIAILHRSQSFGDHSAASPWLDQSLPETRETRGHCARRRVQEARVRIRGNCNPMTAASPPEESQVNQMHEAQTQRARPCSACSTSY